MSHYGHRSGRYYSPSPPPRRTLSRTDTFVDNLERGRVKDAFGAFLPGGGDSKPRRHSKHGSRHWHKYEDEYDPRDDVYYYEEKRPFRHHGSTRRDVSADYYHEDQRPRHRGRSVQADSRSIHGSESHHRHRARSESGPDWTQATKAAIGAGLIEGWRARHDRGRVGRIATAAAGAAGTAMLVGHEGDRKNKRHVAEATLGGLMLDRVVNGSKKR